MNGTGAECGQNRNTSAAREGGHVVVSGQPPPERGYPPVCRHEAIHNKTPIRAPAFAQRSYLDSRFPELP